MNLVYNRVKRIKKTWVYRQGGNIVNTHHIFELAQGKIDKKDLIPISYFKNDSFRASVMAEIKSEIPNYLAIEESLRYLEKYEDNFYFSYNFLTRYMYLNDHTMVDTPSMDIDTLKMLHIKERIDTLEKRILSLIEAEQYEMAFTLIDKRIAFDFYTKSFELIPDEQKYKCFKDIYIRSDYGFSDIGKDFLLKVFKYNPEKILSRKIKVDKDGNVKIYRGNASKSTPIDKAFSWTTNLDTAIFFATRFNTKGTVYGAKVKKEDILGYIEERGEFEIIVNPDCILNPNAIKL